MWTKVLNCWKEGSFIDELCMRIWNWIVSRREKKWQ